MNKREFLEALRHELRDYKDSEIADSILFYSEIISDKTEDGASEEEAVADLGPVEELAAEIRSQLQAKEPDEEMPREEMPREEMPREAPPQEVQGAKRTGGALTVLLLVLGFPLWFPLLAAAFVVLLALYISLWAVNLSIWAAAAALGVSVLGCLAALVFAFGAGPALGLMYFGAALAVAGLCILFVLAALALSKVSFKASAAVLRQIVRLFTGRREKK